MDSDSMKNSESIQIGDIVYFKSGSPQLTIGNIVNTDASVHWYSHETNQIVSACIPLVCLTKKYIPITF